MASQRPGLRANSKLLCNARSFCPIQLSAFRSGSETPPRPHLVQFFVYLPNPHQVQGAHRSSQKEQRDPTAWKPGETGQPCCRQAAESDSRRKAGVGCTCLESWLHLCDLDSELCFLSKSQSFTFEKWGDFYLISQSHYGN